MALFNESLEGRFNQAIQRLHGHKGMPPAPQIAPEILHVIVLEQDRPESYYLLQTDLWAATRAIGADATHVTVNGIRNPAGSGVLCVITSVTVANKALVAALIDAHVDASITPSGQINVVEFRDVRRKAAAKHPGIFVISDNTTFATLAGYQASTGFPAAIEEIQIAAGGRGGPPITPPLILPPGRGFALLPSLADQRVHGAFARCVRPLAAPA